MSRTTPPLGYFCILRQLMLSEHQACATKLCTAGIAHAITDNGDPDTMPRGHFDLEIDLWVPENEIDRARDLLRDVTTWTGRGRLGDQMSRA